MPPAVRAAILVLGAFTVLTVIVLQRDVSGFDHVVARAAERVDSGLLKRPVRLAGLLGSPVVSGVLILLLCGGLLVLRRARDSALVIMALAVLSAVEIALRVRPESGWVHALAHAGQGLDDAAGYPSGHVARLTLLAGIGAGLAPERWRAWCWGVAIVAAVLASVQRVTSGAHTGSEALGGLLLGAGLAATWAAGREMLAARAHTAYQGCEQDAVEASRAASHRDHGQ
jgi:membrane-associated phospholipid phosphatase